MKYKCEVIKDLLPLYVDGVSSKESNKIIEEHLKECKKCEETYEKLKDNSFIDEVKNNSNDNEESKKVIKSIKNKIFRGKLLFAVVAIVVVLICLCSIYTYMNKKIIPINYEDNINILEKDGNIYAVLKNNTYINVKSKIVETVNEDGNIETSLYFYFSTTLWDNSFNASSNYSSEYILVPTDKEIPDNIYYFVGDYKDLEIQDNLKTSTLLWKK